MKRKGIANLPLHGGHPPAWLFQRMVKLAGGISEVIINEFGTDELLNRLSNPYWFQAFSCVLGFDWHSSGTTTTTCGALKKILNPDNGVVVAGGKGNASRKTPNSIIKYCDLFSINDKKTSEMVTASKLSAKIDNSCIQDGYQLYQHFFFITENGNWAIIQQGMNTLNKYARRYHWLSETANNFLEEPHTGISCNFKEKKVLNMATKKSKKARKISVDLICDNPEHLRKYFKRKDSAQKLLTDFNEQGLTLPKHHEVLDMDLSEKEFEVLKNAWEIQPENYEELILLKGIGPKKIRALALISDLVFGEELSWKDPVKYSFTHGGKDGFPYPVNREVYDYSIKTIKSAINDANLNKKDKLFAIKQLTNFIK